VFFTSVIFVICRCLCISQVQLIVTCGRSADLVDSYVTSYNVFSGTLNPTQSIKCDILHVETAVTLALSALTLTLCCPEGLKCDFHIQTENHTARVEF